METLRELLSGLGLSNAWAVVLSALLGLVGVGVALQRWLETDNGRVKFDTFRLKAWGIGSIVKNLAIARFCRILGTLLHNGVPILQSLRIEPVLGNGR